MLVSITGCFRLITCPTQLGDAPATLQHEIWHLTIHKAYANGPWAAFESWLKNYKSKPCSSPEKAKANAEADLADAIIKIEETIPKMAQAKGVGHPSAHGVTYQGADAEHPNPYVKCHNPDWGANALDAVNKITVEFAKPKKGDCPCED